MYRKIRQKVKFCCLLSASIIILIFSIIFLFSITDPLHVMAQKFMRDNSSNLLTINIQDVLVLHTLERESNFEHLQIEYKGASSIIPSGINRITTSLYYQNMSSQDYTIEEYQRSGGFAYIKNLEVKCTDISTKSMELKKAEYLRELIVNAKFFDQPSYQVPKGADQAIFKIKIRDDGTILKDGTHPTNTVTGKYLPHDKPALKDLIQYVDKLCQEISK